MLEHIAEAPSHHCIYGRHCDEAELLDLFAHYSVYDWLFHLSRLSNLLCGSRHRDPEYCSAFLNQVVPPSMQGVLHDWFAQRHNEGQVAYLFTDRQIGILIELALLYAPREEARQIESPEDLRNAIDALLMLVDLEDFSEELDLTDEAGRTKAASLMAVQAIRSKLAEPHEVITRGAYLYQIAEEHRSSEAEEFAGLFEQATGTVLEAYFMGGICTLLPEYTKKAEEIGRGWQPAFSAFHTRHGEALPDVPDAYHALKCAEIEQLTEAVKEYEKDRRPVDFNLIAIKKYPLIYGPNREVFPLFVGGITDSLCEGIYQEVAAAGDAHLIAKNRHYVSGLFGKLYEQHVLGMLEERFGDRLMKNPHCTDTDNEAADGIVLYDLGVVVFQIKGCHVPVSDRFATKSELEVMEEYVETGLAHAVGQIQASVGFCRQGLIKPPLPYSGLCELSIRPVAVTYETIPLFGPLLPLVAGYAEKAKVDDFTCPLVIMDESEVGLICGIRDAQSAWRVLTDYSNSKGLGTSLRNYLGETGLASGQFLKARGRRMWEQLKRRLGLSSCDSPGSCDIQ